MSRLESRNFKVSSRSRSYDVSSRLGLEAMMSRLGRFGPRSSSNDYRTRLLIEETKHVKESRLKLGEKPHADREPRVGHPCFTTINYYCLVAFDKQQIEAVKNKDRKGNS